MSFMTSSKFASAAFSGTDWRDTSKKVLEALDEVKSAESPFNFGFIYISDHLADDALSILNLFRSVLNIENWVGSVGLGICGHNEEFIDVPAISAMVGQFDPDDFCVFPGPLPDIDEEDLLHDEIEDEDDLSMAELEMWLNKKDPMLALIHADPQSDFDTIQSIRNLRDDTGGFLVGGMSSSRKGHFIIANDVIKNTISGAFFSQDIAVASTLSQGCVPIGPTRTVTQASDFIVQSVDNEKALEVFENDLRSMAMKKIDKDPNLITIDEQTITTKDDVPEDLKTLFKGDVHAAFPISETDQKDFLVRNILGIDSDNGYISVSQNVTKGERIMFVYRDEDTVQKDLSERLNELRQRIENEHGECKPKGGIYVSCAARANTIDMKPEQSFSEVALIRDIIGDIPLAGFYAGGEINNGRLHGYTGILTLFL